MIPCTCRRVLRGHQFYQEVHCTFEFVLPKNRSTLYYHREGQTTSDCFARCTWLFLPSGRVQTDTEGEEGGMHRMHTKQEELKVYQWHINTIVWRVNGVYCGRRLWMFPDGMTGGYSVLPVRTTIPIRTRTTIQAGALTDRPTRCCSLHRQHQIALLPPHHGCRHHSFPLHLV